MGRAAGHAARACRRALASPSRCPKLPSLPAEVVHAAGCRGRPAAARRRGEDAPKVPFWKKELSLGGKKADKPANRQGAQAEGRAECRGGRRPEGPVLAEEGGLLGWQEGNSVGNASKRTIPQGRAEPGRRCRQPPVAAADLPPLVVEDAPKVPFWKKDLSIGGKKGDKPVKERKQKAPKVKAERATKTKEGAEAAEAAEGDASRRLRR